MKILSKNICINFLVLFLITITSCNYSKLDIIQTASSTGMAEHQLGQSEYYISLPKNLLLDEARGKEGQLGYGIYLIDSIMRYESSSGFIEIARGRPIGGGGLIDKENVMIDMVNSTVLGKKVKWKIYLSGANYLVALTKRKGLTLTADSRTRSGLDSMISIISTLKTNDSR